MNCEYLPDEYTRRARLYPFFITALPLVMFVVALTPEGITGWDALWSLITWSGGTTLIALVSRFQGKKNEVYLYQLWGGKPTTRMLRHTETTNEALLFRYHKKLKELLPDLKIPTSKEEKADPQRADEIYEVCVLYLIANTRDKKRFKLIYEELCNYGFARNLWGLKPFGIGLSVVSLLASLFQITTVDFTDAFQPTLAITTVLNLAVLFIWLFVIKPDWIKQSADTYADRLLASCEKM